MMSNFEEATAFLRAAQMKPVCLTSESRWRAKAGTRHYYLILNAGHDTNYARLFVNKSAADWWAGHPLRRHMVVARGWVTFKKTFGWWREGDPRYGRVVWGWR